MGRVAEREVEQLWLFEPALKLDMASITTLSAMECWRGPRGTRNMRRNLSK